MTIQKYKSLSAISLLVLVLTPVFIAVYFLAQQTIIRNEMKEKLEEEALLTFKIVEKSVSWIEKGKELLVDGKLFDVKSFKNTGGYLEVTGLFDEMELSLQHRLIFQQNPAKDNKQKQEFIYQLLIQQQAEKTKLPSWEISLFKNVFVYNPTLPDIMLRDPYLLLIPKPPDTIVQTKV